MNNSSLSDLNKKAKKLLLSFPKSTTVRVVSHYDADGITAASIICISLLRAGYPFHVTLMRNPFTEGFKRLQKENNELIIFCDMGSGQIEEIKKIGCKIIICDHHQPTHTKVDDENIIQINAHLCEIDGTTEASGSSIVFSLATTIDEKNNDLLPLALVGSAGDKQHLGGFKGFNEKILRQGLQKKQVVIADDWVVFPNNLAEELYSSIEPYFSGISGHKKQVMEILNKFGISKDKRWNEIDEEVKQNIRSLLLCRLLKQGCSEHTIDRVTNREYMAPSLDMTLTQYAELLDSCGKQGERGIGIQVCFGDERAKSRALELRHAFREKVLEGLKTIDEKGTEMMDALQYFYAVDSSLGGVIGGIAMNYCLDQSKPVLSLAKVDDEVHISARTNQELVETGVDLGAALKQASKKVNGHGGGHNIAAGATITASQEKEFLQEVDRIVKEQITT